MFGHRYVCDKSGDFGDVEANAVCKELGYDSYKDYSALPWNMSGFITMNDLDCPDEARNFSQCSYDATGYCREDSDHTIWLECEGFYHRNMSTAIISGAPAFVTPRS